MRKEGKKKRGKKEREGERKKETKEGGSGDIGGEGGEIRGREVVGFERELGLRLFVFFFCFFGRGLVLFEFVDVG